MNATVLKGTPREVAEKIARLGYEHVEAIVMPETPAGESGASIGPDEDIFAEMKSGTVNSPNADDSRKSIYTRMPGE